MHAEIELYLVLDAVDLAVLGVGGANEEVVGDVVQVPSVLEPWASHTDVVRRALALGLDQDGGILQHQCECINTHTKAGTCSKLVSNLPFPASSEARINKPAASSLKVADATQQQT